MNVHLSSLKILLSETVHEFWRMFIEHDSNCIVQLHTINDVSVDFLGLEMKQRNCSSHLRNVQSIIRMILIRL